MAKFTIDDLKKDVEHWQWFPLEYVLGSGYAMQFMFMDYDEDQGLFFYKHGFTRKYLILSIDNIENSTYTTIKAWMEGCDFFIWEDVKEKFKDDHNLYEAPFWIALQDVLFDAEKTYGSHPGIPFNDEVNSKIHKALKEQGYNIKTVTPEDIEKMNLGEIDAKEFLGIDEEDEVCTCPDCGEPCSEVELEEEEASKVGGKYLN